VVEASWLFAFLFLNNNLHALHHERPAMAWFLLPAAYRAERTGILKRNGFLLYKGYRQIFARYLVRPIDQPIHPIYRSARG
jgi:fatty acid desaturase